MSNKSQKNIPDGWLIKTIDDTFDFIGKYSHSKDQMSYGVSNNRSVFNIHYGDIHTRYSTYVDFEKDAVPFLKKDDENIDNKKLLQNGDLIIADASEDYEGVCRSVELLNIGNNKCIAGLHTFALRDEGGFTVDGYRSLLLRSPIVHNWLTRVSTYSKVYGVSKDSLQKTELMLPPINEQKRIVKVLEVWDGMIEKMEKKIALKKNIKKGLMQQLLTGKKRLPGFDGEWEEKKLGEIASICKGEQLNREHMIKGAKIPVINGGIEASGFTDESNAKACTITISEGGNSCGYVNFIMEDFWCGGHCYTILPTELNKQFLYFYLKNDESRIMHQRVGSGLPNIQRNTLTGWNIKLPKVEEREVIANVLTVADKEIELLEEKLENIKDQKRFLLNNLVTGEIRVPMDSEKIRMNN